MQSPVSVSTISSSLSVGTVARDIASVPSAVTTYKAAVRTAANSMCTQMDNAANVDALAALYVYNSEDPPTRPLGEWPDEPTL